MRIGVYPGTFDPITNGHIDIIKRAINLFDQLYIVIPTNVKKTTIFDVDQRLLMVQMSLAEHGLGDEQIKVVSTPLLTTTFSAAVGAVAIIRGLRMMSDYEYELQLFAVNKCLNSDIETIFIMSSHEYSFLSSSVVKEIAAFGGDFAGFVPSIVEQKLKEKYSTLPHSQNFF